MYYKNQFIFQLIVLLTLSFSKVVGQKVPNVGEIMPNLEIPKIANWSHRSAKISDFKDQLLILDFWSVGCAGCVEALPKMEALQKQFDSKIQIMPVAKEPEAGIVEFWKNNKYTKGLTLPTVVEDKVLNDYFIHRSIPHEVWIYKGIVIGITEPEYVDANNIAKVLSGEKINWPVKYDYYKFDSNIPLFKFDNNNIDTATIKMKYAAICGFKEGVVSEGFSGAPGTIHNTNYKTVRTFFLNEFIFNSYQLYWGRIIKIGTLVTPSYDLNPNQVVWEVADRNKYKYERNKGYRGDWLRKYAICFESVHPDTGQTDKQIYRSIISDMDALLGLKVRWEKRREKVLVIVKIGTQVRKEKKSSNGKLYSIYQLISQISQIETNPYVFDESKSKQLMLLDINNWTDMKKLQKALQDYGLDLKEEEREVDKFVFTEVNILK